MARSRHNRRCFTRYSGTCCYQVSSRKVTPVRPSWRLSNHMIDYLFIYLWSFYYLVVFLFLSFVCFHLPFSPSHYFFFIFIHLCLHSNLFPRTLLFCFSSNTWTNMNFILFLFWLTTPFLSSGPVPVFLLFNHFFAFYL